LFKRIDLRRVQESVPSSVVENVNVIFVICTGQLVSRPYVMVAKQRIHSNIGKRHGQIAGNVVYQLKNVRLIIMRIRKMWNAVAVTYHSQNTE